jgi:hypothetical protein
MLWSLIIANPVSRKDFANLAGASASSNPIANISNSAI